MFKYRLEQCDKITGIFFLSIKDINMISLYRKLTFIAKYIYGVRNTQ